MTTEEATAAWKEAAAKAKTAIEAAIVAADVYKRVISTTIKAEAAEEAAYVMACEARAKAKPV